MKRNPKSALIGGVVLAACALGLSACGAIDKIDWPHVYGPNEVPADVVNEPRAVEVPPPLPPDTTYPRLGDVPPKPKDFTPAPAINQSKQQMETERAEAQAIKQKVQDQPASASDRHSEFAAKAGVEYALAESGSEVYTLTEVEGSPPISQIHLPGPDNGASGYAMSYLAGKKWSLMQTYAPHTVVSLPGATAIQVTLLNSIGGQLTAPDDFAFYLRFTRDGNAVLNMTGNEPPIANTYVPLQLPPGGNPPISGASSVPAAKP